MENKFRHYGAHTWPYRCSLVIVSLLHNANVDGGTARDVRSESELGCFVLVGERGRGVMPVREFCGALALSVLSSATHSHT